MSAILVASMCFGFTQAQDAYLDGIGYREQELQVSKGKFFESETPSGVSFVSFGGGTHIFIKGVGLAEDPQSNQVFLHSDELDGEFLAPSLTEDDAFNSHTPLGAIAYRLPAIDKLIGLPMNFLD